MLRYTLITLTLVLVATFVGCTGKNNDSIIAETQEKHYQRGQRLLREGREQEALLAFSKIIEKRSDAAESHLELGRLFDNYVGDPIAAIYHYRKFLELQPESQQAPLVKQLIDAAKKSFARQLPAQPFGDQEDRLDLLALVESMRKENIDLKQQIAKLQAQLEGTQATSLAASSDPMELNLEEARTVPVFSQPRNQANSVGSPGTTAAASESNPQPTAEWSAPRMYTVQNGDNLSTISKKMYGTSNRYMDLYQANRDRLSSPDALKVGMVLRIP